MLFIYYALQIGGIETFLVRMADERARIGKKTKILLTGDQSASDKNLLDSAKASAEIYYINEISDEPLSWTGRFRLIGSFNNNKLNEIFSDVEHIHTCNAYDALFAFQLTKKLNVHKTITVGFYHFLEYARGNANLPYYEIVNRRFVLDFLPKPNVFVFYQAAIEYYKNVLGVDLSACPIFPIGVAVEKFGICKQSVNNNNAVVRICCVARLVDYKPYLFSILDVVKTLANNGVMVVYDIYGDGPEFVSLQSRIIELKLTGIVSMKGEINYSEFNRIVSEYDLFLGSGTALIQASWLGVPSIVCLETTDQPVSYGLLSELKNIDYSSLMIGTYSGVRFPIDILIKKYLAKTDSEKKKISEDHIRCVQEFSMASCNENFEANGVKVDGNFKFSPIAYEISLKLFSLKSRILKMVRPNSASSFRQHLMQGNKVFNISNKVP